MPRSSYLLALLLLSPSRPSHADDTLEIGDRRQVFIDGRFLESSRGVKLHVHKPRKTGEMSIGQEHAWETRRVGIYGTVMKLGDTYHLWYEALSNFDRDKHGHQYLKTTRNKSDWRRYLCYARSSDGIHWEKPKLGIAEFRNIVRVVENLTH